MSSKSQSWRLKFNQELRSTYLVDLASEVKQCSWSHSPNTTSGSTLCSRILEIEIISRNKVYLDGSV